MKTLKYKGFDIFIQLDGRSIVKEEGEYLNTFDSLSSAKYVIDNFKSYVKAS